MSVSGLLNTCLHYYAHHNAHWIILTFQVNLQLEIVTHLKLYFAQATLKPFRAGIDFRRQNLTSIDVRI